MSDIAHIDKINMKHTIELTICYQTKLSRVERYDTQIIRLKKQEDAFLLAKKWVESWACLARIVEIKGELLDQKTIKKSLKLNNYSFF